MTLEGVQERLGHTFAEPDLLVQALTHSSYAHEQDAVPNERLEFLGDAILQAATTILLYARFPDAPEGELSRFRARLVNTEILAGIGSDLDLGAVLRLGRGEDQSGGRRKLSVLADATEAVLGALYLDAGFQVCLGVVGELLASPLETLSSVLDRDGATAWQDPRSRLQEVTQRRWQRTPRYEVVRIEGPAHDPVFEVEARLDDQVLGSGTGGSKKEASRLAAAAALAALDGEGS